MRPEVPSDPTPVLHELPSGPLAWSDVGRGPAVVMVHGAPGSGRDFRWLAPALEGCCRVIRVDLPGFGSSPLRSLDQLSTAARARAVMDLLDHLGLEEAVLVGHSIGGPVVVAVAVASARVGGVALVASPGFTPHRSFRRFDRRRLGLLVRLPGSAWVLRRAVVASGFPRSVSAPEAWRTCQVVLRFSFQEHAAGLRALAAPTAVIYADDDPLVEPEIGQALAEALPPGPRVRFGDGGHNPQKSQAFAVADAVWALTPATARLASPRSPASAG